MKNIVWLASYPRSGNTWFRIVLSFLLGGNQNRTNLNHLQTGQIANSRIIFDELSGISSSDLTTGEINNLRPVVYQLLSDESNDILYLKTHDKYFYNDTGNPVFPESHTFGCVYFIRNPLDVAVSNAYYFNRGIDEIIRLMNSYSYMLNSSPNALLPILEERPGTWSEHAMSWYNSGVNIHFIRYEDLINQPFQSFSQALDFLGLQIPDPIIEKAISDASIENLRKLEKDFGFREKLQNCSTFFRSGKSGTWKTVLTEHQVDKIINEHREVMKLFGYMDADDRIIV